jgi:hypothetical protein
MRIPDDIRKCVAFIGILDLKGNFSELGTVFFVADSENHIACMVTAKHVIDGARNYSVLNTVIRLNKHDGSIRYLEVGLDDWRYHPNDTSVDVAVYPLIPDYKQFDIKVIATEIAMTASHENYKHIGHGDEVFIAGLFTHHYGKNKNIPIIRTGHIALMREEPVYLGEQFGDADAYLIEARSIKGLSGSPVFINKPHIDLLDDKYIIARGNKVFWLGLIHGHFRDKVDVDAANISEDIGDEKINAGIAIVVPVEKILEVIKQPLVVALHKHYISLKNTIKADSDEELEN